MKSRVFSHDIQRITIEKDFKLKELGKVGPYFEYIRFPVVIVFKDERQEKK